jgi:hypothetical protein
MATPFVSGVVSLLVGLHPDWSAEQLTQRVLATTKPLPSLNGMTASGGVVDAAQAVGVAGSGPFGDHYAGPPAESRAGAPLPHRAHRMSKHKLARPASHYPLHGKEVATRVHVAARLASNYAPARARLVIESSLPDPPTHL